MDRFYVKGDILRNSLLIAAIVLCFGLMGCETAQKVGNTAGAAVGEGANVIGSVTKGGAEAIQGKTTPEENPYDR